MRFHQWFDLNAIAALIGRLVVLPKTFGKSQNLRDMVLMFGRRIDKLEQIKSMP